VASESRARTARPKVRSSIRRWSANPRPNPTAVSAQIASDQSRDAGDGIGGAREVRDAASTFAKAAKDSGIFFLALALQNDGINQNLGMLRESQDLRKLLMAGVIAAVADDDQGFFFAMAEAQMVETFRHRVIKRGASASGDGGNGFLELTCAVGERLSAEDLEPDGIIEVDDEHLVLRIAGMREGGNCGGYLGELGAHAAAVVHDEADGHGSVFLLEESEFLRAAILEDGEVLQVQSGDDIAMCVRDADRKCN